MKTATFIWVEDRTDVTDVLQELLSIRVSLAAVSPGVVFGEGKGVMNAVVLVCEVGVVALPDLLELGSVLELEVWSEGACVVFERAQVLVWHIFVQARRKLLGYPLLWLRVV